MFKWTKVMLVAAVLMGAVAIFNTSEAQAGWGNCGFRYNACYSPSYCYTPNYTYCYTPVTYCYPTYTYCYQPVTYCYPTYTYCYQPVTYCYSTYSYCAPVNGNYCFPRLHFRYCW